MRKSSILIPLVSFHALAACSDSSPRVATKVALTSGIAPALVAFRDGVDAPWQPATMKTPTSFEAEVHGPYTVVVVCDPPPGTALSPPMRTLELARTPDDPHDLDGDCDPAPSQHAITGHMVQAGFVALGSSGDSSDAAGWDFALHVNSGSYDLIAASADHIAIRRAVVVSGDLAVTPPIDVETDGMALVDEAFTATNALPGEKLSVAVGLLTPTNPAVPATIYFGPIATAKAAPDAALAATDTQSVSLRAETANAARTSRRPFRAGGDLAFTLPPAIGGLAWAVNDGALSVSWATLPPADSVQMFAFGLPSQGRPADFVLEASARFLSATGIAQLDFDTDIPGFKPEWKLDVTKQYQRGFSAQQGTETGTLTTSDVTEIVNSPAAGTNAGVRTRSGSLGSQSRR